MVADSAESGSLVADAEGLVWGYRFHDDGQAEPLDPAAAMRALDAQEGWIWLHFDLVDNRVRSALAGRKGLPAEALDLLLGTEERQQLRAVDDVVAGVAADFEHEGDLDPRQMVTWRFCMAPHAFISARRRPLATVARVHDAVRAGRRFPDVLRLFDAIIHAHASAMGEVSRSLAQRLDAIEDALLDARESGDYGELGSVRRSAVRLHRQALPLRAMLHHLIEERPSWFNDAAAEDCTRVAHRVDSLTADLVALQERARALQDEMASRQTEEINRRLMLLSIISALLLPPTLISGLFGMNVDGLPFKDNPHAFHLAVLVMVVSSGALLVLLRRLKMI